jgi:hypothetical protein
MTDLSNWNAKAAGQAFARSFVAKRPFDVTAIKANAQKLLASADPDERKVGEYHMAFCAEIESNLSVTN